MARIFRNYNPLRHRGYYCDTGSISKVAFTFQKENSIHANGNATVFFMDKTIFYDFVGVGSMRRYVYSHLLRMLVGSLLILTFIPSVVYFLCTLFIDESIHIASLMVMLACLILWIFLALMIAILNKKARNSILFEEGKMIYKNRTVFPDNMKYFKFYISVLDPTLVVPALHINGDNLSVTCYLSKRDIKKLKQMNFEIKDV